MTDTTICWTSNNCENSGKISKKACILYLINLSKINLCVLQGVNVRLFQWQDLVNLDNWGETVLLLNTLHDEDLLQYLLHFVPIY